MTRTNSALLALLLAASCGPRHPHEVTTDLSSGTILSVAPKPTPTPVAPLTQTSTEWDAAIHAVESVGLHPAPLTRPGPELVTDWHMEGEHTTINAIGGPMYTIRHRVQFTIRGIKDRVPSITAKTEESTDEQHWAPKGGLTSTEKKLQDDLYAALTRAFSELPSQPTATPTP
jgi:hypothetical protein